MAKKTKKKNILENIKNFFKKLWQIISNFFKKLWKKFMKLPKYIRLIVYVWLIVLLIILILIYSSHKNSLYNNKYEQFENEITEATKSYLEDNNIYPSIDKKLKLDINFLIDDGELYEDTITDKTCLGFSISYYNDQTEDYVIDSYLNCKHYTTNGYLDYTESEN